MKNSLCIITLVLVMAAGCAAYGPSPGSGYLPGTGGPGVGGQQGYGQGYGQEYGPDMDMDYMYNYLAPHGNWINLEPYGYVWTPRHMGYRWRPYSQGHWVMTDYGWTWMANEEWGSIPFHYGRWGYDDDFGWFWVPGTVWGPAWVSWRWSNQYAGWAPLPPGIEFRAGMDFASLSFNIPSRFWIFLQAPHFLDRNVYRYALPYERNLTIINITSIHNNIHYRNNRIFNEGMGIDNVQRVTRQQVPRYRIQDVRKPGPERVVGNDIQVYRPAFRTNATTRPKAILNRDRGPAGAGSGQRLRAAATADGERAASSRPKAASRGKGPAPEDPGAGSEGHPEPARRGRGASPRHGRKSEDPEGLPDQNGRIAETASGREATIDRTAQKGYRAGQAGRHARQEGKAGPSGQKEKGGVNPETPLEAGGLPSTLSTPPASISGQGG